MPTVTDPLQTVDIDLHNILKPINTSNSYYLKPCVSLELEMSLILMGV